MLSCRQVADRASDLIDGNLSTWEALRIHLHLAMCRKCSRFIEQIRATDRLTAEIARMDHPARFEAAGGRHADLLSTLRGNQPRR